MEIYQVSNRLFIIVEVDQQFTFERKKYLDDNNQVVQKWELLMRSMQQQLVDNDSDNWGY